MAGERIAVGFDGTEAARQALIWAVREAGRRRGSVLVVRAWETGGRAATPATAAALRAERVRLDEQMREAIRTARLAVSTPRMGCAGPYVPTPVIARELIIADPMTALCHAARMSDVVVVGAGVSTPARLARRLARRRRRYGGPCPLLVIVPPVPTPATHPVVIAPVGAEAGSEPPAAVVAAA